MSLGVGETLLIVLILSLIFGVGWISGLAGLVRKSIRGIRDRLNAEESLSAERGPDPAGKKAK